jgi:AcrR family transcriptional regulator
MSEKTNWVGLKMDDAATPKSFGRGRPAKSAKRQVIQKIMAATEAALEHKTVREIKIRDVAADVGVDATIVNYYFGGKDGLMEAMFLEIMHEAPYPRYENISQRCVSEKSIRPLIEEMANFYYSRPALTRMTLLEMIISSSKVHSTYHNRYFASTPTFVKRIIEDMIKADIYNGCFDRHFLTASILGMLTAPLFSTSDKPNITERLRTVEWVDHVSALIDLALKATTGPIGEAHDL